MVSKNYKRVVNNGNINLSKDQRQVLDFLTVDFMTVKEISNIRGTTQEAVYKIIRKLKNKQVLKVVSKSNYFLGVSQNKNVSLNSSNKIYRVHGASLTIQIQTTSNLYQKLLKSRNKDEIDNNTLMLEENNITIHTNKDFWGDFPDEGVKLMLNYIERFIIRIENAYKITLQTRNRCDLKYFRCHIAKVGDPYARKINLDHDKIKIYDDMGVLRLLVDKSFNYDELETVSMKSNQDMNVLNDKWMDLITCDLKLSDVEKHLAQMQHYQKSNEEFKNEVLLMIKALALKIK